MCGYVKYKPHVGGWFYVFIYREDGSLLASIDSFAWDDMQNNYGINVNSDTFIEDVCKYLDNFCESANSRGECWQ